MTQDKLLEQAIELLALADFPDPKLAVERNQVVKDGVELLLQPQRTEQEPVAWIHTDPDKPKVRFLEWKENEHGYRGKWIKKPLYFHPPWSQKTIEQKIEASIRHYTKEIERAKEVGDPHQFVGTYEGFVVCLESILEKNT
jgi:hypothetical protein